MLVKIKNTIINTEDIVAVQRNGNALEFYMKHSPEGACIELAFDNYVSPEKVLSKLAEGIITEG